MSKDLMKYGESVELTKETIKQYLCAKANDQECQMFFEKCKLHKLNPFAGDANLVKYSDKAPAQMIVTEQAWNRKLQEMPGYLGTDDGLIVQREGKIVEEPGEFYLDSDKLLGAWCVVKMKDKDPVIGKIRLSDYDKQQAIWNSNKARMINKTARVHTIRKAIPDMAGLYTESEMNSVNGAGNKRIINITPDQAIQDAKQAKELVDAFDKKLKDSKTLDELNDIARHLGAEIKAEEDKAYLRGVYSDRKKELDND